MPRFTDRTNGEWSIAKVFVLLLFLILFRLFKRSLIFVLQKKEEEKITAWPKRCQTAQGKKQSHSLSKNSSNFQRDKIKRVGEGVRVGGVTGAVLICVN